MLWNDVLSVKNIAGPYTSATKPFFRLLILCKVDRRIKENCDILLSHSGRTEVVTYATHVLALPVT